MSRKSIAFGFECGAIFGLLGALVLASGSFRFSSGILALTVQQVAVFLSDPDTQWVGFFALALYYSFLVVLRFRSNHLFSLACLSAAMVIVVIACAQTHFNSISGLTLLGCVTLGQGLAGWSEWNKIKRSEGGEDCSIFIIAIILLILLSAGAIWTLDTGTDFSYHLQVRATGPWTNPNTFGVLMGTGIILAGGLIFQHLVCDEYENNKPNKWCLLAIYLICAFLLGRGLLRSFSRGAWISTCCGAVYFVIDGAQGNYPLLMLEKRSRVAHRFLEFARSKRNWLYITVATGSIIVLLSWRFSDMKWLLVRRAVSAVQTNDFSRRNRITAWEGALQIIAEHPGFGVGWNNLGQYYQYYYAPSNLFDHGAIQVNDFLLFAATLGIPALLFLGFYVWYCLTANAQTRFETEIAISRNGELRAACRAGAVVLLIGFWFDGGVFDVPTSAVFWILLELGRRKKPGNVQAKEKKENS